MISPDTLFIPQLWAEDAAKRMAYAIDSDILWIMLWYDAVPKDERGHYKGFPDLSMQCCLF